MLQQGVPAGWRTALSQPSWAGITSGWCGADLVKHRDITEWDRVPTTLQMCLLNKRIATIYGSHISQVCLFPVGIQCSKMVTTRTVEKKKETIINFTRECLVVSNSTLWGQSLGLLCFTWQEKKLQVFPSFLEMDLSAEVLGMPILSGSLSPASVCNLSLICACS